MSFEDVHEAFAASRVSQYVFEPTRDVYFNTLDQHADTLDGDVKAPLVLLGNEGSGKSALLANWVSKRREHKHRDEFLFQHFVGCSSQSLQLMDTLYRLETALKTFFQLREMKVPETEVELRWSLNRFLEAASKKHFPARIVIIIDGINRLKGENAPEGALHWLPTELPPCVRFIVSTVETERSVKGKKEGAPHRTFVELVRRQCPMLSVEPLGTTTRTKVLKAFINLHEGEMQLTEEQCFKIVAAEASAQPMFLRTLLQGLKLAIELTNSSTDRVLEQFLNCTTASELLDRYLNICCRTAFADDDESMGSVSASASSAASVESAQSVETSDIMGKMLSVVYVSRSGLNVDEIWSLIKMVSKYEPTEEQSAKLLSILNGFTMVVDNMHSFSHEIYREVIYQKYINSHESLIRWHNVLARFFGQLPPCDRKLVALPYHLETAGSWSKVKNCLTEIEMFQLWWTPKFKSDFIKFWASLTAVHHDGEDSDEMDSSSSSHHESHKSKKGSSSLTKKGRKKQDAKPVYDMVEEYTRSLDEYRLAKHPSDETVSGLILTIADFLLEFATLGHEQAADVPAYIHPKVLNEDLQSVGVPYVEIDEEGRSSLVYPDILVAYSNRDRGTDDGPGFEGGKAIDDMPECTTYFFSRWMWMQFPYIALGNCDGRYTLGANKKITDMADNPGHKGGGRGMKGMDDSISSKKNDKSPSLTKELSKSWGGGRTNNATLPKIKFNRKAAKSHSRVSKEESDSAEKSNSKVAQRMDAVRDNIANYREEYDFVVQMKAIVEKRLQDLKDTLNDLYLTAEGCNQFDGALGEATKRESAASAKADSVQLMNKNLQHLSTMADRHPAEVPALIENLQMKIEQDAFLIHEIKKRLWEQRFEKQTHVVNFRHCKKLVAEAVSMHNTLLEYKYNQKKLLTTQAAEDERALLENSTRTTDQPETKGRTKGRGKQEQTKNNSIAEDVDQISSENGSKKFNGMSWEEVWQMVSSRTGIMEPDVFFQRIKNRTALLEQINTIQKSSEARLEAMKKEAINNEVELEEVRYKASFAGMQSSKEHVKSLAEKQQRLKHSKEKAESAEQLEQNVVAGLAHISEMLFIPKCDDDAPVMNLVRDIETVLDTLINEREKQLQQIQTQGKTDSLPRDSSSQVVPESLNRSPELDFAIARHEHPKVRLPKHLPSRSKDNDVIDPTVPLSPQSSHEDDPEQELGTWDRTFVKSMSSRSVKTELKRQSKLNKTVPPMD